MLKGARIALFLATSGHSGVDRIMGNLIREFARRGFQVDLLHVAGHGPTMRSPPAGVQVVHLGSRHVYASLAPLSRYLRRVRPSALLCDKHKVNLIALWARALAGVSTRIVLRTGTTVSLNLAKRPAYERWLYRLAVRRFYPHAQAIVMPSRGAADDMAGFTGLARSAICVVPNPIVDAALRERLGEAVSHPWLAQPRTCPLILGVGELGGRKDFATLVRAFAGLRAERACRLIILGRGRQRERLLALAGELGVAPDIDLPGFVSNPYAYMAGADLFVSCSLWEGLSNVLVEALAAGLPSVATDCPNGPREILQDGRLGDLVPVRDPRALQVAMVRTLAAPPARETLRKGARRYGVGQSANTYLKLLLGRDVPPCDGENPPPGAGKTS